MTFNLIVSVNGEEPIQHILNANRIGIGRAQENQIRLNDKSVSLAHLELRKSGGERYEVEDLGSRNGIQVNGKKVRRAILRDGDRLLIGKSSVAYFFALREETDGEISNRPEKNGGKEIGRISPLAERIAEIEEKLGRDRKDSEALQKLIKRLEAERLGHQERCESLENIVGETLEKIRVTGKGNRSKSARIPG